jgi:hypothetical protein
MPAVPTKKMNWIRPQSAWGQIQTWNAKRKAMRADFEASQSAFSNGFTNAVQSQTSGLADLAARSAVARVQAEGQARREQLAKVDLSGLDLSV